MSSKINRQVVFAWWDPVLNPTMPSAAPLPLPWGGAGSGPHKVFAALFWKKRNFKPCAPKYFQEINVLASRIASLKKALR